MSTLRLSSARFLLWAALAIGCNNDPGIESAAGSKGGPGNTGGGHTGLAGTGGSNGGNTGGSSGSNGGGNAGGANGNNNGGANPDVKNCTATSAMAKQLPVDIYVLLDRSGSMLNDINDDGSMGTMPTPMPGVPIKWDAMVEALTKFVNAPSSAGFQMGLGVFPPVGAGGGFGGGGGACQVQRYATPVFPVTELPGGAMGFLNGVTMSKAAMGGGTPTLPALRGAIMYARQREAMVGRRLAIALATDGMPNDCQSTVMAVANEAMMGAGLGTYTFVIGVGKRLDNLNQIAVAGGTKMAYLVENATADQLAAAFKEVQSQASKLVCSFMIPPPPAGMMLDPNKVNVRFNTPDPAMSFQIPQVMDRGSCGPQGGWYYDNPSNPRTVNLCEASCMKVNSSGGGSIELLFGCAGVIIK